MRVALSAFCDWGMMLRVTVELLPHGDESQRKVLDVIDIVNDGTGSESVGNYRIDTVDVKGTRLDNFARSQGYGRLVALALSTVFDLKVERRRLPNVGGWNRSKGFKGKAKKP